MLGRTAGGLFWMFRYLERSENTARLLDTGFRIALTGSENSSESEWESIVTTAGGREAFVQKWGDFDQANVTNFLLRDRDNSSSVLSCIEAARSNGRMVRTALSSEVWEAVNEAWMTLKEQLEKPVSVKNLAEVLTSIRQHSSLVRGALHGTMLRNDIYDFSRLGTFIERADNTARILDVKYYVLLPSAAHVGGSMDNMQWETILRSVSAFRSFRWLHEGDVKPKAIADFLILDRRMPRSLAYCLSQITGNLTYLSRGSEEELKSLALANQLDARLNGRDIDDVFEEGLHEFLKEAINQTANLASQIQDDFRFYG
ncbi:alpha-E domain-containing protein [Pseudooceanicola sp. HF7]|uniref:alpha-E domain-containing protein n=1 Tax=Pseudooceanicola sp. HF7 TaxID=2721560 RepID=UPI00142F8349|nr:alpha-E domain-containing protein [Pseudooceanicola sp. HF7]NIZ07847.1 alpha-E domain-containing protein [Pseudooceanicola sp. HF7]